MKPAKVKSILQKKATKMAEVCTAIHENFKEEDIHKFRVQLKSLRAFIRLLKIISGQKGLKISRHVKRLYKILGKMRDSHLQLATLTKQQLALPAYLEILNKNIKKQKKKWCENYSPKKLERFKTRYDGIVQDDFSVAILASYLVSKIQAIRKICRDVMLTDARIHELRKQLKDMLYVMDIAKEEWPEGKQLVKQWPVKQIAQLATDIGKYNDGRIRLAQLNSYSQSMAEGKKRKELTVHCSEEVAHLLHQKKELINSARQVLTLIIN